MEKRTNRLYLWASDRELDQIRKKMKQCRMTSTAGYLRKMAIDGYIVSLDTSDIKEVVRLLRICSNNLNQYARRANEGGSIYLEDIKDLKASLENIWQAASGTLEALAAIT